MNPLTDPIQLYGTQTSARVHQFTHHYRRSVIVILFLQEPSLYIFLITEVHE